MVWICKCSTSHFISILYLLLLLSLAGVRCEHPQTKYSLHERHNTQINQEEHVRFVIKFRESVQEFHKQQFAEDHQLEEESCVSALPHWMQFRGPSERTDDLIIRLKQDPRVDKWNQLKKKPFKTRSVTFSDPLYRSDNGSPSRASKMMDDVGVSKAWDKGYTGENVLIQVVDEGVDYTHPDLKDRYNNQASYDVADDDTDPSPGDSESHGTSVAGIMMAVPNNDVCTVGIAYNSKYGAIKLLTKAFTSADAARVSTGLYMLISKALSQYSVQTGVDISQNSWGSADTGVHFDRVDDILEETRKLIATSGRSGKGIVTVWAGGNGHQNGDNCNYDEYSTSPFIITVGATDENGYWVPYSEHCAALLINAPSSGITSSYPGWPSLGNGGGCVSSFGGTSAAAPVVSGVVALILHANPNLTYRDVMHILIGTAYLNNFTSSTQKASSPDSTWTRNAAGLYHSYLYGFGRVNANTAVSLATNWSNVGDLNVYPSSRALENAAVLDNTPVTSTVYVTAQGFTEQVNVFVDISHPYPNELEIVLISPEGTESLLTTPHNAEYTYFSPRIPSDGIQINVVNIATVDSSCQLLSRSGNARDLPDTAEPRQTYQDKETPFITSAEGFDLSGSAAILLPYPVPSFCDVGDITKKAQEKGASLVFYHGPLRDISGSSAATIPSISIPSDLANYFENMAGSSNAYINTQSFNVTEGKFSISGNLEDDYRFLTVRSWGENPNGQWTLRITDTIEGDSGLLRSWYIEVFAGQRSIAESYDQIQRPNDNDNSASAHYLPMFTLIGVITWVILI